MKYRKSYFDDNINNSWYIGLKVCAGYDFDTGGLGAEFQNDLRYEISCGPTRFHEIM